jgi:hypothetical protein
MFASSVVFTLLTLSSLALAGNGVLPTDGTSRQSGSVSPNLQNNFSIYLFLFFGQGWINISAYKIPSR